MKRAIYIVLLGAFLVAAYFITAALYPKYTSYFPVFAVILLLDLYLWFSLRNRIQALRPSLAYGLTFLYWGAGVNTGGPGERSFGTVERTVSPLERSRVRFELLPPPPDSDGSAGVIISIVDTDWQPATRPPGLVTRTWLEFDKAAYEGLPLERWYEALGL